MRRLRNPYWKIRVPFQGTVRKEFYSKQEAINFAKEKFQDGTPYYVFQNDDSGKQIGFEEARSTPNPMRKRNPKYLTPKKPFGIGGTFFSNNGEIREDIQTIYDWLDQVVDYYKRKGHGAFPSMYRERLGEILGDFDNFVKNYK